MNHPSPSMYKTFLKQIRFQLAFITLTKVALLIPADPDNGSNSSIVTWGEGRRHRLLEKLDLMFHWPPGANLNAYTQFMKENIDSNLLLLSFLISQASLLKPSIFVGTLNWTFYGVQVVLFISQCRYYNRYLILFLWMGLW